MKQIFIKIIKSAIITFMFMFALYLILSFCFWSLNFNQWGYIVKNGSFIYFLTRSIFLIVCICVYFEEKLY